MSQKNLLVLLVSVFALAAICVQNVSAFGQIVDVEVNGVDALGGSIDLANFAGQRVPILVVFKADAGTGVLAEDVRIKAWISGESQNTAVSNRLDVLAGRTYTETIYLDVPSDLDDDLEETRTLELAVESKTETADEVSIDFTVQRESYLLDILNVNMQTEVNAGEPVVLDVVLKNLGRHGAEDVFLDVKVPQLGLQTRTYFGDLSPLDNFEGFDDESDAEERRTYLKIPANVEPGLYDVIIEASNGDSFDRVERRVLVTGGAVENTMVISPSQSKNFGTGETETFELTIVNRGTVVRVFDLVVDSPENLNIKLSDSQIVVPAGSSRTVEISADSSVRDDYTFTVDVQSDNGASIAQKTFRANISEGNGSGVGVSANTTVLLTVILAIVFVVLLVVLIVLLTRKPETKEEFGESYY